MAQILIVEDDSDIAELMKAQIERNGDTASHVTSGEAALSEISKKKFNLFVLDWMLPGLSGVDVAKRIRANDRTTPILMVTAKTEPKDVVEGLDAGADDYVTKPFDLQIFRARIQALLRRVTESATPEHAKLGNLEIRTEEHRVFCGKDEIHLTVSEFKLLVALHRNAGRVLTRDQLIDLVQGTDVNVIGRAIDTHMFGLRKKLGTCSDVLETVRGVGYRVRAE